MKELFDLLLISEFWCVNFFFTRVWDKNFDVSTFFHPRDSQILIVYLLISNEIKLNVNWSLAVIMWLDIS
jgi:hypothetical protein